MGLESHILSAALKHLESGRDYVREIAWSLHASKLLPIYAQRFDTSVRQVLLKMRFDTDPAPHGTLLLD